jgi:hypothetical protein
MIRRVFPLVALLAIGLAAPAAAGLYFSAVTTSESAVGAAASSTTVRGWVQDDKARLEFTASRNPLLKPGRYLLTLDGGRSIYLVDPTERTFSQWHGDAAIWSFGQTATQPAAPIEKLGEDEGGELLGMPTRHLRYRTSYPSPAGGAMRQSGTTVVEEELWVAPQIASAALGIWMRQVPADTGTGEADAGAAAERARYEMFPLKRVAVTTTTSTRGGGSVAKTTTTVTELSVEEPSPGTFKMGSGFREKALSPASSGAEQPVPDVADEVVQEDQQYPFEDMVQPEPQVAPPASQPGQPARPQEPGAQPAQPPQPGAHPAVAPTPQPVVPEEPQEDPEYPFERMLDTPN